MSSVYDPVILMARQEDLVETQDTHMYDGKDKLLTSISHHDPAPTFHAEAIGTSGAVDRDAEKMVDVVSEPLFADEPSFANFVLRVHQDLVANAQTPKSRARERADDLFANGPRIPGESEARELLERDPEFLAFLRLKFEFNARAIPEPWAEEYSKVLMRRG